MARLTTSLRLLRVQVVLEMTRRSRSFFYASLTDDAFSKQIHLGPRTIVWNKREVVQWTEDRIVILGATTDDPSIRQLNDGLGIFASGPLLAIVTDYSWSDAALGYNVFADAPRCW